jgi:hypothetical protein
MFHNAAYAILRLAPCAGACEKQSILFFARKRCDQLFAANLTQKGQIVAGKFPQHIRRNLIVIMSKDVADTRNLGFLYAKVRNAT